MYELDGSPQLPWGNAGTASAAAAALGKRLGWSNGSRGPRMETSILRCSKPSSAFPLLSTLPKTRAFPCSPALGRAGTPGGTAPRTEMRANPPVNPTPPAEQGRSPPSPGQRCEATSPAPPRHRSPRSRYPARPSGSPPGATTGKAKRQLPQDPTAQLSPRRSFRLLAEVPARLDTHEPPSAPRLGSAGLPHPPTEPRLLALPALRAHLRTTSPGRRPPLPGPSAPRLPPGRAEAAVGSPCRPGAPAAPSSLSSQGTRLRSPGLLSPPLTAAAAPGSPPSAPAA